MWIPRPLYEHAPWFWLLLGLLFLAGALWLGFGIELKAAYFLFAAFCLVQAVWTLLARRRYRRRAPETRDEAVETLES